VEVLGERPDQPEELGTTGTITASPSVPIVTDN